MGLILESVRIALVGYGLDVVAGIVTLIIGMLVAKMLTHAVRRALKRTSVDTTLATFITNLAHTAMLTLVVITALDKLGFPAVSFAAVVGAAGLAIGLALKGTLSNLAAGVILIALRPFSVGDRIEAAGVSGTVTKIHIFSTTLAAPDQKKIIIPNATLSGGNIINYSTA